MRFEHRKALRLATAIMETAARGQYVPPRRCELRAGEFQTLFFGEDQPYLTDAQKAIVIRCHDYFVRKSCGGRVTILEAKKLGEDLRNFFPNLSGAPDA